jgi:O-acetyl-ADP-ribose deacetylase (regulator of RNase III)
VLSFEILLLNNIYKKIMIDKIEIKKTDITTLAVDAIVNAANKTLLGGGGVDGAIHRAAGVELLEECKTLKGCKTGEAKITKGYNLPSKFVIHTVGPVWSDGKSNECALLAECYKNSLMLALKNEIKSIAFPCISTGVYGFPQLRAAEIAFNTIFEFLSKEPSIEKVIFVCFLEKDYEIYNNLINNANKNK